MNSFLEETSDKPNIISEFDSNLGNIVLDEAIVHKNKTIILNLEMVKKLPNKTINYLFFSIILEADFFVSKGC